MTEQAPADELVVGIDLGTTNSLVAQVRDGRPTVLRDSAGHRVFVPSVVSFSGGRPTVGAQARLRARDNPTATIHSVKRLMGRNLAQLGSRLDMLPYEIVEVEDGERRLVRIKIEETLHSPEEISATILRSLRERAERALGQKVTGAVVTVPAYFDDSQRQATRDAGRIAGLDVLRIVNEPTAAALAYGLGGREDDHTVAVYDLGGGTFDVSILRIQKGVFRVLSTHGDTYLGGDDFDLGLIQCVAETINEQAGADVTSDPKMLTLLRDASEATKKVLTVESEAIFALEHEATGRRFEIPVRREDFETIIASWVDRTIGHCKEAVANAGLVPSEIDAVVLVGGSTRVPLVRQKVAEYFGREPLTHLDPDEAVALGAAVQADILTGENRELLLLDVIPLSLGIETMGGAVSKLILRNDTVPVVKTETYTTQQDDQSVEIHILQGERELVTDCHSLARFTLKIPPMPAGLPRVEVTFMVDADGILTVTAHEQHSDKEARIEVVPVHGLTENEVDSIVADSIRNAREDVTAHRLIDLRNESATVIRATQKTIDDVRELVSDEEVAKAIAAMKLLEDLLEVDDAGAINKALDELNLAGEPLAQIILDRITSATVMGKRLSEFPG